MREVDLGHSQVNQTAFSSWLDSDTISQKPVFAKADENYNFIKRDWSVRFQTLLTGRE